MPELPEVESVARSLRPRLVGAKIVSFETSGLSLRRPIDRRAFERACIGFAVEEVRRIGKYLLLSLSSQRVIVAHLGMSGRLVFAKSKETRVAHTHAVLGLSNGLELRYVDPRRFGVLAVYETKSVAKSAELSVLGPDPFESAFSVEYLIAELRSSKRNLKNFLLDQSRIAGLGNIYVCEALFRTGLSPRKRAHRVPRATAERLHQVILDVLETAVRNRGTSFSDYVDADGIEGSNQQMLLVYGREGDPCRSCGAPIKRLVQGGRSTFYCPKCQK